MNIFKFLIIITICLISYPALAVNSIKIGLYTHTNDEINAGVSHGGVIENAKTGAYILVLEKMQPYKLKKMGDYILITIKEKQYRIRAKEIIIKATQSNGLVYTKKRWYKGQLIILNDPKGLTVINQIGLEDYIKGVVAGEMPSSWHSEALKAQAIAARSYAVAYLGKRLQYGYDLKDTPQDQHYVGMSGETVKTNSAVDATKGQVLVHNNKVIPAYYHASSGGSTINAKSVWGKDLPFVKPVRSFDDRVPRNGHGIGLSQNGANVLANRGYSAYQILGYFYKAVMLRTLY